MDTLLNDLRYGVRQLLAHRRFTVAVLLVLGLGIGANATIFSLVDAVFLRPLPAVAHPERLVQMKIEDGVTSYPAYRDLRDDARDVIDLGGVSDRRMSLRGDGRATLVDAQIASANYFSVLGVMPAAGRLFAPADGERGAPPVAVLSYGFWRGAFGGDPSIIGRTVDVDDRPVLVIGVAAKDFRGLWLTSAPDIWVPISAWPTLAPSRFSRLDIESRGWGWVTVFGRLAPGATAERAASVMNASFDRQKAAFKSEMGEEGTIRLQSSLAAATGGAPRGAVVAFMSVLMAVVALVLLLVCANVANLLLSRAAGRRREFGVRIALGATRARLVRQLVTESLVLSLAAVFVAYFVMSASTALLGRATIGGVSLSGIALDPDARVLAFTAAVALVCALAFGLLPARQTLAADVTPALRDGAAASGASRSRVRGVLLAAQLALSLVLLIGAGLFTRALQRALRQDPGFRVDHVAMATVDPGLAHYDAVRAQAYYAEVGRRLAALPDIASFTWAAGLPLSSDEDHEGALIPGYTPPDGKRLSLEMSFVGSGYFSTLRIPLRAGREFEERDTPASPRVAVVNETMAARFWPGQDAVGRQFVMLQDTVTIIGVAHDAAYHEINESPRPYVYLAGAQFLNTAGVGPAMLVARTRGDPDATAAMLRTVMLSTDPHVTPYRLGTLEDRLRDLLLPQRAGALMLGAFSLLALIVSLVGVHGVVSYAVSRRTREIGIRIALGARPERVVRALVRQHLPYIAGGLAGGLLLAAAGTRILASFLYGVSATDLPTFASAALLLAAVAILAAVLPARRAARVDPMIALRYE